MAYRFTNTEKWQDSWFSNLKQIEMLLFIYLCDNCDIAGFIEINYKRWANDLSSSIDIIQGACKGLERGLVYSKTNDCIFIRNFIKHQKNLPLNENNKAHLGILKRFELYTHKFDIQNINDFIEGASKGLYSSIGIGIGNDISIDMCNDKVNVNVINNIVCHLNNKTKKDFKTNSKKTQSCIKARLNEGYSYEDFIKVIDIKSLKWNNDPKMKDFLRPETLFGSKFESYLNEETKQVQRPKIDVSTKFEYVEGWKDERE